MLASENYARLTTPGSPRARLICFPHAGAGPAAFGAWQDGIRDDIELAAIRLPGHEYLFRKEPLTDVLLISKGIADLIAGEAPLPTCFFGYCGGAFLAFETTRQIGPCGTSPVLLAVCSQVAPHKSQGSSAHLLPAGEFRDFVRAQGATKDVLMEHQEIWEILEPALRADYAAFGTYRGTTEPAVTCDIVAYRGADDHELPARDLDAWAEVTSGAFSARSIDGGHFLMDSSAPAILAELEERLLSYEEPADSSK